MCNTRGTESSLDELFGDGAMQLLMRRDGATESDVRAPLSELRDARAVASGGTARESGTSLSAGGGATKKKSPGAGHRKQARSPSDSYDDGRVRAGTIWQPPPEKFRQRPVRTFPPIFQ
jgi:hypothetical protein